jgi:DNA-binding protein H-NS
MDRFCEAGRIPLWRAWLQTTIRKGRSVHKFLEE